MKHYENMKHITLLIKEESFPSPRTFFFFRSVLAHNPSARFLIATPGENDFHQSLIIVISSSEFCHKENKLVAGFSQDTGPNDKLAFCQLRVT